MARFLSREWLAELQAVAERAAATGGARGETPDERPFTLQQVVTGGPEGDVTYRVRVADGSVQVEPGPGDADVVLVGDYATAAAVSRGELTPAAGFAAGRLRVGGRVGALVEHRDLLARLGELFAGVRESTTYP